MRYFVDWEDAADNQLMAIWFSAADRTVVTSAVARLVYHLTYRPLALGIPRESSVSREVMEYPISLLYEVVEDDKKVVIQSVYMV